MKDLLHSGRAAMIAGVALDVAGAALIVTSIEEGGPRLILGIGLLAAGSSLVFRGALRSFPRPAPGPLDESFAEDWRPEPELQRPSPRPVRLSSLGKRIAFSWAAMLLAAAAFLALQTFRPDEQQRLLESYGASAIGEIHDKAERPDAAGRTRYYLYFRFEDRAGRRVRGSVQVAGSDFGRAQTGDTVRVLYLPEDPFVYALPEYSEARLWFEALPWALAAVAALAGVLELYRRKHRRLVAHGRPAPGRVVAPGSGLTRSFTVEYRAGGETRTLRGSGRAPELRQGDAVTVLCLPERTSEALIYRSSLYRAVETQ